MIPSFLMLWPLAVRRSLTRWRLLLPLLIGSIIAVGLLSSTFVYGDSVRELGLEHAFESVGTEELDINLISQFGPTDPSKYDVMRREVDESINRRVIWFVADRERGMEGETFYVNEVATGGQSVDPSPENIEGSPSVQQDPRRRAFFYFQTGFRDRTTLIAGSDPELTTVETDADGAPISSPEIPVLIMEESAVAHGVTVGDQLLFVPFRQEILTHGVARVAGIVRRNDPADTFWQSNVQSYVSSSQTQNFIPLYIPEETYLDGVGPMFPKMLTDFTWTLFVDPGKIDVENVELAKFAVEDLDRQLRTTLRNFNTNTGLPRLLNDFQTKELFGRVPLLIMVLMIMGIVTYYLVMVANVVVDRHLGEVALLRSRGADASQVMTLYLWEAATIVVIAFFVGPLLAVGATSLLGLTPAFSDLTGGQRLPMQLTVDAYALALGGSAIAFLALLLPTVKAAGLNPLLHRLGLARPPTASFINRYYIDVLVSVIAGLLFWELTQKGSVVSATLFGGNEVDRALLAAPALFLLAISLLLLRFFPMVTRLLGRMATGFSRAWLVMGLWQMGRNPGPYTRPILLLMLAASVAMFAANFGATVDRSYLDRARYASGGDLIAQGVALNRQGDSVSFADRFNTGSPDIVESPAYRGRVFESGQLLSTASFDLLAVDPKTFADTAWYRDDFSDSSVQGLMRTLDEDTPETPGFPLPADAETLRVWVRPASVQAPIELRVRTLDANHRHTDFILGQVDSEGWQALEVSLEERSISLTSSFTPEPPLRLLSLSLRQLTGETLLPGAIYLDRIDVTGASGELQAITQFETSESLDVIRESFRSTGDSIGTSTSIVREGSTSSGVFIWGPGSLAATRGVLFEPHANDRGPLHLIASRTVLENHRLSRGDGISVSVNGRAIPGTISEVVDYFPTMDPFNRGFLVANLHALLQRVNAADTVIDWQPTEVWLASNGADRGALVEELQAFHAGSLIDRVELQEAFRADPLIAAGWRGILSLVFIAVLFVTLLGFGVYSYVQAQQRRLEFALLRSMGLSIRGLASIVLLEQAVVVIVGIGLGSWFGYQLTSIVMPFLGLNEEGTRVLPAFAARVNWPVIIATYGAMSAVFVAATVGLIVFFSRIGIQKVLRFGEP